MDILTPAGQLTMIDEKKMADMWSESTGYVYSPTPKNTPCAIDALLFDPLNVLVGVAEAKCRYDLTVESFRKQFRNEWLVTMDKLIKAADIASSLCVPLYGFLYLCDEPALMTVRLTYSTGQFAVPFRCCNTETQATCNGGRITRANAYIKMDAARLYRHNS